ncbi:MAG: TlpA family protein disulfide reductase [Gammaproteobacteria bacterium]|jgi:thiol-disulfide isomerase/thioredoxin|nr:TlpA family protein disulfide reductase [Gammaproteobacteria bacterium]MBT3858940.1 TlpA family protein disulfide reductase [Gammaproteobacteria bacterium]MBT3988268.1 TlpA family protein disulfide reductase [Gammaproteobacteria bacterium]MBT4257274.1 TlpA family protein disulfide reductase [Gammaproteobacteria bacterium]MBT4582538.1 TlpA family protein disulfide reductase [Gammaproteobacteria bacterium]
MIIKSLPKILLATLAACCVSSLSALEEGDMLPEFSIPSIYAGKPAISSESLKGKTVLVDFWASWCAPCLTSLPLYNELYHKYKDQDFEVVAITVDNPIEDGLDFLLDTPLDFLIPVDPLGEISELFEVYGMPTSYLIDASGTVQLVHMGFRSGDIEIIEEAVKKALAGS